MRWRKRTRFAAPWIVVMGCSGGGGGADRTTTPPTAPRDASVTERSDEVPIDADTAAAAPTDAATKVTTLPPDRNRPPDSPIDPCKMTPDPSNPTCNPPAPKAMDAKILAVEVEGSGLVLSIDKGADAGIQKGWRGQVLNESGKAIAGAEGDVIRIGNRGSRLRITMTDLPLSAKKVRLFPPR